MRDNHEGLPEILSVTERDGKYFCVVSVEILSVTRHIEFGIPLDSYQALKRITQTRPFDLMPGLNYRFFTINSFGRVPGEDVATATFRIELGPDSKQISTVIPDNLAKNLKWFFELSSFDQASHLKVTEPGNTEPVRSANAATRRDWWLTLEPYHMSRIAKISIAVCALVIAIPLFFIANMHFQNWRIQETIRSTLDLRSQAINTGTVEAALQHIFPVGTSSSDIVTFLRTHFGSQNLTTGDSTRQDEMELVFMLECGSGFVYRERILVRFSFDRYTDLLRSIHTEDSSISL